MFETKLFDNTKSGWDDIKEKIIFLENQAFEDQSFAKEVLEQDFLDSKNIVVLIRNVESKEVVGFAYAKPYEPETEDGPARPGETAWIWDIVIQKEFRGKHLTGQMLDLIEEGLKSRGFKYLEMNARVENNFAKNIEKHYKERIIKSFPLDSRWGAQVFFRIKL